MGDKTDSDLVQVRIPKECRAEVQAAARETLRSLERLARTIRRFLAAVEHGDAPVRTFSTPEVTEHVTSDVRDLWAGMKLECWAGPDDRPQAGRPDNEEGRDPQKRPR
jgi:hypothetical protein